MTSTLSEAKNVSRERDLASGYTTCFQEIIQAMKSIFTALGTPNVKHFSSFFFFLQSGAHTTKVQKKRGDRGLRSTLFQVNMSMR